MITQPFQRVGIIGGTFDPIHCAHLAIAQHAAKTLALTHLVFIPAGKPYQKQGVTEANHRLAMTELAASILNIANCQILVSSEEIKRHQSSYMVETLAHWRTKIGQASLSLILGSDQLLSLHTWFKWSSLIDFAHLYVVSRPHFDFHKCPNQVQSLLLNKQASLKTLQNTPSGHLYLEDKTFSPLSATLIREQIRQGNVQTIADDLPQPVLNYILEHHLYQSSL